ncbi:acyl carrier protein [Nocardia nova]|jgi:acyl carrier protein|uniref:acyl carrier protein n=1 Tax=Nocardia nova TaxID=37330 RepID=UPI0007A4B4BF|nr:acyl carrier protein [Nocardia nova]
MNKTDVVAVIIEELGARGCHLSGADLESDLIGAGMNSVNLVRVLSSLENRFDIEFDSSGFFTRPVTIARLEAEITSRVG